jgi:hypothetical protein
MSQTPATAVRAIKNNIINERTVAVTFDWAAMAREYDKQQGEKQNTLANMQQGCWEAN